MRRQQANKLAGCHPGGGGGGSSILSAPNGYKLDDGPKPSAVCLASAQLSRAGAHKSIDIQARLQSAPGRPETINSRASHRPPVSAAPVSGARALPQQVHGHRSRLSSLLLQNTSAGWLAFNWLALCVLLIPALLLLAKQMNSITPNGHTNQSNMLVFVPANPVRLRASERSKSGSKQLLAWHAAHDPTWPIRVELARARAAFLAPARAYLRNGCNCFAHRQTVVAF